MVNWPALATYCDKKKFDLFRHFLTSSLRLYFVHNRCRYNKTNAQ